MALPALTSYSVGTGQPIHGGRWPGGRLTADAALSAVLPAGTLADAGSSGLYGDVALSAVSPAGTLAVDPPPDWQSAGIYVLGLSPTYYTLGWPRVSGITSYEYSLDDGSSWTSTGTTPYAEVTGRTASTTDLIRVRAINAAGSSEITGSVTLPGSGAPSVTAKTIGTGGDYSTPSAWEAACPDLVATNTIWEGRVLNEEIVGTSGAEMVALQITTGDATRYLHLTAAPGAAFCDHEDRRTNPLRYDATYGASLRVSMGSLTNLGIVRQYAGYSRISRLQFKSTGNNTTAYGSYCVHSSSPTYPVYIDQCVFESGALDHIIAYNYGNHYVTRCVGILTRPVSASPTGSTLLEHGNGVRSIHNTWVSVGQTYALGSAAYTGGTQFKNDAILNVVRTHNVDGSTGVVPSYTNCASDASLQIPSGVTTVVSADCLESVVLASPDARLKAGSPLIGAGVYDATYSVLDITNTVRPLVSPDIGAWQSL